MFYNIELGANLGGLCYNIWNCISPEQVSERQIHKLFTFTQGGERSQSKEKSAAEQKVVHSKG